MSSAPILDDRTTPLPPQAVRPRRFQAATIEPYVLPTLFVLIFVMFSLLPSTRHTFLSAANIRNVLANQAVIAIAAIAVLSSIVADQYDLSIGAAVGAAAMGTAGAGAAGWPTVFVILIGPVIGLGIGTINGVLVAHFKVNSLIATLGTSSVIAGMVEWYSGGTSIIFEPGHTLNSATFGNVFGIPRALIWVIVAAIIMYLVLDYTTSGRYLHALGSNPTAARLVGMRTRWLTLGSLAFTGLIAGIGGVLDATQNGSVSPQNGPGFTLLALAAVFLGSTAIQPGRFNVLGTVIAVYLVAMIVNGLTLAGAAAWVQPTFNGLALLAAVAVSVAFGKRAGRIQL